MHRAGTAGCALLHLLTAVPLHAQLRVSGDSESVVETSGSAQLTLQPTSAVVTFAAQSRAPSAAQATALNAPRVRRLLAALTASRPTPDSVLVVGVSVGPNENMDRGTVVDYQARAVVKVVIRTLDSLGRYLDVGLSGGATEVVGVTFRSDSAEAAQRAALAQAYAHARDNAEALAVAAGGRLGRLLRVSTGGRASFAASYELSEINISSYRGSSVPVAAQGVTVSASVNAAWRFEAR
jgi:uncharacterized protein YggE